MDTPRTGLIRSTERAIEEYIQEGCEENLPMIRQLEDVVYQFWVESNTSFMNEGLVSVDDDEDGWIWDNECFYENFQEYVKDCLEDDKGLSGSLQEEADDNSSICSSIRLCDETDCSLGYLASCEESDTHVFEDSCKSAKCDRDFIGDSDYKHATTKGHIIDSDLCDGDLKNWDLQTSLGHEKKKLHGCGRSCNFSNSSKKGENTRTVCDNVNLKRVEINERDSEEWVFVDKDCIEMVDFNEWLIVSTCETGAHGEDSDTCFKSENVDLSDWAVLSMRVTERTDKDDSKNLKVSQAVQEKCSVLYEDVDDLKFVNSLRKPYYMPSLGGCPLCKGDKENYKCAIVCVLMQR